MPASENANPAPGARTAAFKLEAFSLVKVRVREVSKAWLGNSAALEYKNRTAQGLRNVASAECEKQLFRQKQEQARLVVATTLVRHAMGVFFPRVTVATVGGIEGSWGASTTSNT